MRRMKTDVEGAASAGATHEVVLRLYEKRKEIYPRARSATRSAGSQSWRWAVIWLTQIVFYGLPWLAWNGRQAVLFDLGARKFYIFGLVLWPQDVIYLAALLIISALSLFLFTAVAGRLWCGYACPQTVYTEIFMWIERQYRGRPRQRACALDRAPWSAGKVLRKGGQARGVDRGRAVDRLHVRRLLHADPRARFCCPRLSPLARGRASGSCSTASRPTATPAGCASRSASTCARMRASRARCSTATP